MGQASQQGQFVSNWSAVASCEMDWTDLKLRLEGIEPKHVRGRYVNLKEAIMLRCTMTQLHRQQNGAACPLTVAVGARLAQKAMYMSELVVPSRDDLGSAIGCNWKHSHCQVSIGARFETGQECDYPSPVGGKSRLVYDVNVTDETCPSILEKPSSWLWFENAIVESTQCLVAYLFLLLIKPEWKRRGVGSAYITAKAAALSRFGVKTVYLEASHEGPRFWFSQGFHFVDISRFWADYAEYCEHNDLPTCEDMDMVVDDFFQYLRDSSFSYPMYRHL